MSRRLYRTVKFVAIGLSAACLTGWVGSAEAHTRLDMPRARDTQDGYKPTRSANFMLPCGIPRTAAQPVNMLTAGATITMRWTETIPHPGCFIIDFAPNDTGPATAFNRLQIEPHKPTQAANAIYQVEVKLPGEPCTNCILRVRQYMGGGACPPANLADLNPNLYYACANVVLSAGGGGDAAVDAGAKDAVVDMTLPGTGGASGTGGAPGTGGATAGGTGGAGTGGAAPGTGGTTTKPPGAAEGGCVVSGRVPGGISAMLILAALLGGARRRRRR